jgi:uncharacterized protein YbbC (DUF1343 family)
VYPGQVIWEGTNLSEGRGTTKPFELFGAPFLNTMRLEKMLPTEAKAGCHLQHFSFRPTFHKWAGELCEGFMLYVLNPREFKPFFTSLSLLAAVLENHSDHFEWKAPPYEYEYEKKPIDLILGDPHIREKLESGTPVSELWNSSKEELEEFMEFRRPYLLYC